MAIEIFNLIKERCLLVNLNIRTEMHGDQRESAVDIAFEFDSANNLLAKLHPDLRAMFYRASDTKDLATEDHMPHLRMPLLGAIPVEYEVPRTTLRVHDIDDQAHDVVLGGGRTNKFKLTLKEGGTVNWKFRVQFSKPDEDQVARLMRVLNQKVPITLECKDEEDAGDNFDKVEKLTQEPHSAARVEAESLFNPPPASVATQDQAVASVIESIDKVTKPKRTTKLAAVPDAASAAEPVKAKRTSRKAAEVE